MNITIRLCDRFFSLQGPFKSYVAACPLKSKLQKNMSSSPTGNIHDSILSGWVLFRFLSRSKDMGFVEFDSISIW